MCYSAQIRAEHAEYIRHGSDISLQEFAELYGHRVVNAGIKIPRALDHWFAGNTEVSALIEQYQRERMTEWSAELTKQGARLTAANRALDTKPTKKAESDQRIAARKINQLRRRMADSNRTAFLPEDARIYPQWYAPVMIREGNRRIVKPMRYLCRPAGMAPSIDRLGTLYNARRDNLEKFWGGQFGYSHGIMLASAFFENVSRHRLEGRSLSDGEADENLVIKFEPNSHDTMLVACLYSQWRGQGEALLSFAAITDEPPPEVAAAGHDRCIIPIKPEHVDAWLQPRGNRAESFAILDDRERPYYQHQVALAA